MAYFPSLRRTFLPILLSSALASCSADSLVPPSRIDGTTHVSAIQPRRATPSAPVQYSYQSTTTPVSTASVDYLDTPNLAGVGHVTGGRRVTPGEDVAGAPQSQPLDSSQPIRSAPPSPGNSPVPAQGINMDAELGVGGKSQPVMGLAAQEEQDIAEGESEEPVVDGIGTDNPVQANRPTLRSSAGASLSQSSMPHLQGQQVAMLRPQNPMQSTEPQYDAPSSPPPMSTAMPPCRRICPA